MDQPGRVECVNCGLRHRPVAGWPCPRCGARAPGAFIPAASGRAPGDGESHRPAPQVPLGRRRLGRWAWVGLAVAAVGGLLVARGLGRGPHYAVAQIFLHLEPDADSILRDPTSPSGARENYAGSAEMLDLLEVLDRREEFTRVRAPGGREGWVRSAFLVPRRGTRLAVALRPVACHESALAPEPMPGSTIQPGTVLFLRGRSHGRWRTYGTLVHCPWVGEGLLSFDAEEVEVARLLARIRGSAEEQRAARARLAAEHPGTSTMALAESRIYRPPPTFRPSPQPSRDLAPSLVPPDVPPDNGWLPVPVDPSPALAAAPDEPLRIAPAASGSRPARALLPGPVTIPLDHPEARFLVEPFPASPRGGIGLFDFPASPEQVGGRHYLATSRGVHEVEVAGLHLVQRGGEAKGGPYLGSLILRPDPGFGIGFLFSSGSPRAFRARTLQVDRNDYTPSGLWDASGTPEGTGVLLRTRGRLPTASRHFEVRTHGLHGATLVEVMPGGRYLIVNWQRGEEPGCQEFLLLSPDDLSVVSRSGCDPW